MARGIEVDWVVIRINTIRRLVAIGLTLAVAAALLVVVNRQIHPSPDVAASRAIRRAEKAEKKASQVEIPENWKIEFKLAHTMLKEAGTAYANEDFKRAEEKATRARSRFEALAGAGDRSLVGEGQFHSVHGNVMIQRAGKSEWEAAETETAVFNGDFIKTGSDGNAEVLFSDGALFRISPNSLLEVHRHARNKPEEGAVKMVVGKINVVTGQSRSMISTDNVETQIDTDSRVALKVGNEKSVISTFSGRAVLKDSGGRRVEVRSREQVEAHPEAGFSEKQKIPPPPTPLQPVNNMGFDIQTDRIIELKWTTPEKSRGTRLQVSRNPDFPENELDVESPVLSSTSARLEALLPGTYFWRLATVFDGNETSEWCSPHRFRIYSRAHQQIMRDVEPPALSLSPARQLGRLVIVEGKTEPGAKIQINGAWTEIDSAGRFRKTVELHKAGWTDITIRSTDPSGNATEKHQKVYLEEF